MGRAAADDFILANLSLLRNCDIIGSFNCPFGLMLTNALSQMPQIFDRAVLLRGQEYFSQGRVLNIRLSDGLIKARVKGSSSHIYDVHMDLKRWPKQPASCTCPYQFNCKHAVACLLALREKENASLSPTAERQQLDRKLDLWLRDIQKEEEKSKQNEISHVIFYQLDLDYYFFPHSYRLGLAQAKILKKGGYGRLSPIYDLGEAKKCHSDALDQELIARLMYLSKTQQSYFRVACEDSDLLMRFLETGRVRDQDESYEWHKGEPRTAVCEWVLQADGQQIMTLHDQGQLMSPYLLDKPCYIDWDNRCIGLLDIAYSSRQLSQLLSAPPIPLAHAETVAKKMAEKNADFPLPKVFKTQEKRLAQPKPRVIFDCYPPVQSPDDEPPYMMTAEVQFQYDNLVVNALHPEPELVAAADNSLLIYPRDKAIEDRYLAQIKKQVSMDSLDESMYYFTPEEEEDLRDRFILESADDEEDEALMGRLYQKLLPDLQAKGWEVVFASPYYQHYIGADEVEWFSQLDEQGHDFFSYQLGIQIGDESVNLVPLIANLLSRHSLQALEEMDDEQAMPLPLSEGRSLLVPMHRLRPLLRLLMQYGLRKLQQDQSHIQISRYQLMLLQESELAMQATRARWQGAESLRQSLQQLVKQDSLPTVDLPAGLQAQLRDYQHAGLNWLQFLRANRFAGILADDMGLGKTIQTLAHLMVEKEQGRMQKASLIVAPTSLMGNWLAEATRFTPDLRVLVFHGLDRHQVNFDDYDLIVSTYGIIQRDKARFVDYPFYYLILDEAQFIKNARTKTTQVIQQLQATHRLCLTGTPMENHLGELWSLYNFLMPGLLGDQKQFNQWFKIPIEKQADLARKNLLSKRVKPFMLRRTKNQVASELPPKTEMTQLIEIEGPQRDLYEAIRITMEKKVRDAIASQGLGKSHIVFLDALLKLRQVCCDPRLLDLSEAKMAYGTSAKLATLMELLASLLEEGRRVLVFSQFTSMLALIEEQLQAQGHDYLKLTGQTQNRQALVDAFQQGKAPIFLISLKAGGTGLNLTRADTVIHYDPWWNPAVEDQATDRSHRIGQENPVFVYKFITQGTVEQAILNMQQKKRALVEGVLAENTAGLSQLTEKDIAELFAPIKD